MVVHADAGVGVVVAAGVHHAGVLVGVVHNPDGLDPCAAADAEPGLVQEVEATAAEDHPVANEQTCVAGNAGNNIGARTVNGELTASILDGEVAAHSHGSFHITATEGHVFFHKHIEA